MNRAFFSLILRSLGLIYFGDRIRYILHYLKNFRANKKFRHSNPSIALPPDYLIYESFRMDYNKYYFGGWKPPDGLYLCWRNMSALKI
jgi:hypothetical protein